MNNKSFSSSRFLALGLVGILWTAVVCILADFDDAGFYFWGALAFGLVSFILVIIMQYVTNSVKDRNTTEAVGVLEVYSVIYLVLSIAVNTFFAIKLDGEYGKVLVIINMVLIVAYVLEMSAAGKNVERIKTQAEVSVQKTSQVRNISIQLGKLLGIISDQELKSKVYALKEKVDYSSNMSQTAFAYEEENMLQLLYATEQLVLAGDMQGATAKIDQAEVVWNRRNSTANTIR